MRLTLRTLCLAAAVVASACSGDPTGVDAQSDAVDAATRFRQLADEAFAAGADPDVVRAYSSLGTEILRGGRVSPVTIVVDGVPQEFLATARQVEMSGGPVCDQPGSLCLMAAPLRSLVAWQRSDPRRVVQLSAMGGTGDIGTAIPGLVDPGVFGRASLVYFDGAGGVYVGASGTGSIGDPVTSDTPCSTLPPPPSPSSMSAELVPCTQASFTASFSGTLTPAPIPLRGNTASGTHTISMSSQSVLGARLVLPPMDGVFPCPDCGSGYPRSVLPPIGLSGGELSATIEVAPRADLVTFTLRVTNGRAEPVTVHFTSGQQFDFRARRRDGSIAWTWSMDKLFTAALTSRTVASGETVTFTGEWHPTEKGTFLAEGRLTSSSHRAIAGTLFTVP